MCNRLIGLRTTSGIALGFVQSSEGFFISSAIRYIDLAMGCLGAVSRLHAVGSTFGDDEGDVGVTMSIDLACIMCLPLICWDWKILADGDQMSKDHLRVPLFVELIIDDYVVQRSAAVNWYNGQMISKYARPGSTVLGLSWTWGPDPI